MGKKKEILKSPDEIFSAIWNLMSNYPSIYLNIYLHELEFNDGDLTIHLRHLLRKSDRVYPIYFWAK